MLDVIKFNRSHLEEMIEQKAMSYIRPYLTAENYDVFEAADYSFTAKCDGKVIGCLGIAKHWKDRGECWAILAEDSGPSFLPMHRAVKRFLEVCPINRIEAVVDNSFPQATRWVKSLGFELEAPLMRSYIAGRNYSLYSRVRN